MSPRLAALLFLAFLVLSAVAMTSAVGRADDFVLIRNAASDVAAISKDDLYKVYTGETKVLGSAVVQTVIGKEDSGELQWLAALFDMRPKDLLSRIKQQVFSGEMRRPVVAKTPGEAIAAVQNSRGGVAVVPASAVASLPRDVAVMPLE